VPIAPAAPAQKVPVIGGFDYVNVDAVRRRVYAAHGGNRSLMIVDADTGKVLGQVRVGPMAGNAVNPENGHVFTGNGLERSVSEVDPVAMTELRSVDLPGEIDAITYDPKSGKIYADEDDGTHIYVVDAKTFKQIGTIDLPGHKPEYLTINDAKRELYQNISDLGEVVVIDIATDKIVRTFATPELTGNHPLQYDPAFNHILVGGKNGVISTYDTNGNLVGHTAVQPDIDQCNLDQTHHLMACAGNSQITLLRDNAEGPASIVGKIDVAKGMHTVAIDPKSGDIFGVWAAADGDWVQKFTYTP
jgi:DNA-binding beta-propeller fold protein YncE